MKNKILIISLLVLVVGLSGCIDSGASKIDGLAPSINSHLKTGDTAYNQAVYHANRFQYDKALEDCSNATNEFNAAKSSADQALTYAKDSNDNVFVSYMGYLVNEIDAKVNATSELQLAIPYMQQNDTSSANVHRDLANNYMNQAVDFKAKRDAIASQNPSKFK
ncbi:hypothetical protein [Methanobacterium aggregans]|uniref:hypothetical protein n=1 Tax=Methanobacterium aggregans TaxID=1615586 RepID=UPI001AE9452D|nr:hypothetical protein [Methanobacterium aggregans]MBP2045013.1 hypothetical protein [Methanobacterium aggregans]